MNLKNVGLRTKLMGGFGLVLAIGLVQGVVSFGQLRDVGRNSTEISQTWLPSVQVLADLNTALGDLRAMHLRYLLAQDSMQVTTVELQMTMVEDTFNSAMNDYAKRVRTDKEKAAFAAFQQEAHAILAQGKKLPELMRARTAQESTEATNTDDGEQRFELAKVMLNKLVAINAEGAAAASAASDQTANRARLVIFGTIGLMIVLGFGIAWVVSRDIKRAADRVVADVDRMAAGDLAQSLTNDRHDEMGAAISALATMQDSLRQMVSGVRLNAESVASASAQISAGNHDLSSRTEQQASALQQTAASMEELAGTVKQNADNARQANNLAVNATTVAVSGGEVVNRVVATMKGINESSRRIADIIGTIDGIAFQTNILALNAAVEAARAGEQGRGFAVVAAEVRSLAQRSAEAAREIKTLISTSVERVEQGTDLVDEAGTTMQEVVSAIKRVTDIMAEISAASAEQSAGVAQVGHAVSQMDQATQQNAALVEESAAAAEGLKGQADLLVKAVAVFKLGTEEAEPITAAPAAVERASQVSAPATPPAPADKATRLTPAAQAHTAPAPASKPAAPAPAPATTSNAADDWETF